jgi:translation initiation factor 2A
MPTNGTSTPPRGPYNRSPAPGTNGYGGGQQNGGGKRHVPGAAPQHSGSATPEEREKKNKKKKDKKKENAKDKAAQDVITNGDAAPAPKPEETEIVVDQAEIFGDDGSVPPTPGGELSLDPLAKKIRNLNKKVSFVKLAHLRRRTALTGNCSLRPSRNSRRK